MVQVLRKSDAKMWAKLTAFAKTFNSTELKVGWFSTTRYEDGTPVAHVAMIHEFGAPKVNIPPRPFMRPTVAREENNWRRFIAQEAPKILDGQETVERMFEALGLNISGQIGKSISAVTAPPLKEATIKAKLAKLANTKTVGKVDKPLVETGIMLDTVTYTVNDV